MMPFPPRDLGRPKGPASNAVAAAVGVVGRHKGCGGQILALRGVITEGVAFVVCSICDNVPANLSAPPWRAGIDQQESEG